MYISDFKHNMKDSVQGFTIAYENQRDKDPENYPMERPEEQWREMFADFILTSDVQPVDLPDDEDATEEEEDDED